MMEIAYSPCPNDTFIFYAWHQGIVGHELPIRPHLYDIQKLNEHLLMGTYPISKVSAVTAMLQADDYTILPVGSGMGFGCGPLLVGSEPFSPEELPSKRVGIPGKDTVAHLLFSGLLPSAQSKHFLRYDEIIPAIKRGEVDCGVIIHESRFTYEAQGCCLIADIGALWEKRHHLPLPLGVLAAKRSLGDGVLSQVTEILSESMQYAFAHREETKPYVLEHCIEKDWDLAQKHIDLYTNKESMSRSNQGVEAIEALHALGVEHGFLPDALRLCHTC